MPANSHLQSTAPSVPSPRSSTAYRRARLALAAAVLDDSVTAGEAGALAEFADVATPLSEGTAAGLCDDGGELNQFLHGLIRRVIAESVDAADPCASSAGRSNARIGR
jgi:hypothetical protein